VSGTLGVVRIGVHADRDPRPRARSGAVSCGISSRVPANVDRSLADSPRLTGVAEETDGAESVSSLDKFGNFGLPRSFPQGAGGISEFRAAVGRHRLQQGSVKIARHRSRPLQSRGRVRRRRRTRATAFAASPSRTIRTRVSRMHNLIDRVIFQTPLIKIGVLRCPIGHPRFEQPGPTANHALVFPRTCVAVHKDDGERFVAQPQIVAMWNPNEEYRREALSQEGAACEWFGFDREVVQETVRPIDPSVDNRPEVPFRFSQMVISPKLAIAQRRVVQMVRQETKIDALAVEERVLYILEQTVIGAYRQRSRALRSFVDHRIPQRDEIVWRAERFIASHFREPFSIQAIARHAGASPFHLCRLFRQARNSTLHARRSAIRLHTALELVLDSCMDLTEISLVVGYSSHSHFTAAFRRHYGVPPSTLRASEKKHVFDR